VNTVFYLFGVDGNLTFRSSTVKSVYFIGSVGGVGQDKLVVPSDFPNKNTLRIPKEIQAGDILFATLNSVYWLKPDRKGELNGVRKKKTKTVGTKNTGSSSS
jgi:hypothetical protein